MIAGFFVTRFPLFGGDDFGMAEAALTAVDRETLPTDVRFFDTADKIDDELAGIAGLPGSGFRWFR